MPTAAIGASRFLLFAPPALLPTQAPKLTAAPAGAGTKPAAKAAALPESLLPKVRLISEDAARALRHIDELESAFNKLDAAAATAAMSQAVSLAGQIQKRIGGDFSKATGPEVYEVLRKLPDVSSGWPKLDFVFDGLAHYAVVSSGLTQHTNQRTAEHIDILKVAGQRLRLALQELQAIGKARL